MGWNDRIPIPLGEDWPDECPQCDSDNIEGDRYTCSWRCGDCGCDDNILAAEAEDRKVDAAIEAEAERQHDMMDFGGD